MSKRANQIASELKEDFDERAKDFATHHTNDVFEENQENKEQVELARFYEQLPKPAVMAIHKFEQKEIFYKVPEK